MISKILILFYVTSIAYSQAIPESAPITGLPDQTQDVYQGWIISDNQTESYLYYQLFSAEGTSFNSSNNSSIPLLMYLEGGPGDSSTLTVWTDFGPYGVNSNINLTDNNNLSDIRYALYKRDVTWSKGNHILSVDSPVFTGYSFSSTGTLMNNTESVGVQLINFLARFYQLYPQLVSNPLFIIGHSYGGHWAPYLSYLLVNNYSSTINGNKITLGSVVLLNPLVNVKKQIGEADYFYAAGVTDTNKRDFIKGIDESLQKLINLNQQVNASIGYVQQQNFVANGVPGEVLTTNITLDNVRRNRMRDNSKSQAVLSHTVGTQTYFNLPLPTNLSGRNFLNIPDDVNFLEGYSTSQFILSGDAAADFSYAVEYLLNQGLHVIFLAAQDDGTVPVPGVVNLVSSLNWTLAADFKTTLRDIWFDDDMSVLGAFKKYGNLNLVTLYNSGHLVTFDQPEAMVKFINRTTTFTWQ